MNNKWKRSLALLLMLALIFTLPMASAWAEGEGEGGGSNPPATPTGDPNAGGSYTLTLQPGGAELVNNDAAMNSFVVDLYLVATAAKNAEYNAYDYTAVAPFTGVSIPDVKDPRAADPSAAIDADALQAEWISAAEAAIAIAAGESATPVKPAEAFGAPISLEPGLYLVVARSTDLTAKSDYFVDGNSIANSEQYVYTYRPQLIAVPGVSAVDGVSGTADEFGQAYQFYPTANADWGNVTATLKPSRELRYGDLLIVKNTDVAASTTFVFHVTATLNNADVYDNMVGLVFDGVSTMSRKIEGCIPVGAEVTVTEEYPGASFVSNGFTVANDTNGANLILVPGTDSPVLTFTFSNTKSNTIITGTGIENPYTFTTNANPSN